VRPVRFARAEIFLVDERQIPGHPLGVQPYPRTGADGDRFGRIGPGVPALNRGRKAKPREMVRRAPLALDMYEHSYHIDYGAKAAGYVDVFMAAINWPSVERSYERLLKLDQLGQDYWDKRSNRDFFPAALKALEPQDWTEIASASTDPEDPLFSEAAEETFSALRARILPLEREAEARRH
jgi:hypothetical protein